MTPLLPPSEIRQSRDSSKLSYCSTVTRSPRPADPLAWLPASKVRTPSFADQAAGAFLVRHPRHPFVDLPSNSSFQPAFFSSGVRLLGLMSVPSTGAATTKLSSVASE